MSVKKQNTMKSIADCMPKLLNQYPSLIKVFAKIRLVITDVDGVLTDGRLWYNSDGEFLKAFHVRDGLGMKLLEKKGIQVAVLSGRDSEALRSRIRDLSLKLYVLGSSDKCLDSLKIMKMLELEPEQVLFVGDDVIDLPGFSVCGLALAVCDAHEIVKLQADAVLTTQGGCGAFREVSDLILHSISICGDG